MRLPCRLTDEKTEGRSGVHRLRRAQRANTLSEGFDTMCATAVRSVSAREASHHRSLKGK